MDQVPPLLTRVGKVLGLGQIGLMKDVLIPASLPGYHLRPAAGLGVLLALADGRRTDRHLRPSSAWGSGQLMNQGRDLGDAPTMYCALILIFIVGVGIEADLLPAGRAERSCLPGV